MRQQSIVQSYEPEYIEMAIPARTRFARQRCANRVKIEAMAVDPKRMLFFPLPQGLEERVLSERLRKLCSQARKMSDNQKQFVTRKTKSGVVKGIGIWRIK